MKNMTTMKKLFALMLAVMMLLSVCMVAVAENGTDENTSSTYTITIDNSDEDHTYKAYQIFTGDLSGNVLSNVELGSGVGTGFLPCTLDGKEYTDAASLAQALTNDNLDAFIEHVNNHLATAENSTWNADESKHQIAALEPGYYLIMDDSVPAGEAYTKFMVKVVKDITASPKTDKPTHEKKVNEDDKPADDPMKGAHGENYNDVADYCIGDTIPFALYSKVPDLEHFTHYEMIFHDKMSNGLSFDTGSVQVTIGGQQLSAEKDEYTVVTTTDDDCTFHVEINELVGKNYAKGAEIRVDFTATLNSDAEIGLPGNTNTSFLEFSNNPNNTTDTTNTVEDEVVVFTYELDITKVDGADEAKTLANAEFVLQNAENKYATVDSNGKITGWVPTKEAASTLKSDENGQIKVIGLDDGTYSLTETKAPEGYNLLAAPIKIDIEATTVNNQEYKSIAADALTNLTIKVGEGAAEQAGDLDTGSVSATVENNQGATLPETGGIGTTIFYVAGGMLVLLAVVLLVTKRRMGENN